MRHEEAPRRWQEWEEFPAQTNKPKKKVSFTACVTTMSLI